MWITWEWFLNLLKASRQTGNRKWENMRSPVTAGTAMIPVHWKYGLFSIYWEKMIYVREKAAVKCCLLWSDSLCSGVLTAHSQLRSWMLHLFPAQCTGTTHLSPRPSSCISEENMLAGKVDSVCMHWDWEGAVHWNLERTKAWHGSKEVWCRIQRSASCSVGLRLGRLGQAGVSFWQ